MTSTDLGKACSLLGELQGIVVSNAIEAAKASESLLTTSDPCSLGNDIAAVGTDVAFPQIEQILFFRSMHRC